jgi:acyl carrier protein
MIMNRLKRDDVVRAIYDAVGRANELREPSQQITCTEDSVLFGPGGLDSLGLVSLILDVEEAVNSKSELQLTLANERAVSRRRNPFRDVRSLADYVMVLVDEEGE